MAPNAVLVDVRDANSALGIRSDSGFESCSRHNSVISDSFACSPQEHQQTLFSDFVNFWHSAGSHDCNRLPSPFLSFYDLWPSISVTEKWILEKVAASIPELKSATENFMSDLVLFAVRSGPSQLLEALRDMGMLNPGEQLSNNFTAFQTAIIWRNTALLSLFGCDAPEVVRNNLKESADSDYFRAVNELDATVLGADRCDETFCKILAKSPEINFNLFALLLYIQKTYPPPDWLWNELLLTAVENSEQLFAEILIFVFGADINYRSKDLGKTCLHIAASKGHFTILKQLLRFGANPNTVTDANELPEELCAREIRHDLQEILQDYRKRRLNRLKSCLEHGEILVDVVAADLNMLDENGCSLLTTASSESNSANLQILLSIPDCPINAQDCQTGRSLLANAVDAGNICAIPVLLAHGASPAVRDFLQLTPLDIAVDRDDKICLNIMLENKLCWTGLHGAMKRAKSAEVSQMLQQAFKNRQFAIVKPALFLGASTGDLQALSQLEQGDKINVRNDLNESPAFVAAKNGQLSALEIIVELGGDFWSRTSHTMDTPLHAAAAGGFANVIRFLATNTCKMRRPLGLDDLNTDGKTPVHLAAEAGHCEALTVLLELGASCTGYFKNGLLLSSPFESCQAVLDAHRLPRQIAIFRSIENGNLRTLRAVWLSKFDHYFRDHSGDTPIMVAAQQSNLKVLDLLLESAEQEYRPVNVDINQNHDASVEFILRNKNQRPDESLEQTCLAERPLRQTAFQWIFGNLNPDKDDCIPTIVIDEHRLSHVSAINVNDGCCAVHRAIEVGDNVDTVKRLVSKDPYCVNIPEHNGFTALHLAVILQRRNMIRYLAKLDCVDLYATDLLGRMPEELVNNPRTQELLCSARTVHPTWWSTMCDEQIPVSTAEGLSEWTRQFSTINLRGMTGSPIGSTAQISLFAGKTSASQDGVYDFIDQNFSLRTPESKKSKAKLKMVSEIVPSDVLFMLGA